ncbi:MAG: hypothetical protein ABL909_05615 [Sphingopyxis sp.]
MKDESYIIDLCDKTLGQVAERQHRFDFLRGDPGKSVLGRMLPVDAWYPDLALVIEYHERQHTEKVAFFDRRETVSGVGRGAQRALYDQRRRDVLPQHSISLVILSYFDFEHRSNKRLLRVAADSDVIRDRLAAFC